MAGKPLLNRWMKFNTVGLLGVPVQLGCIELLHQYSSLHYLFITVLGVEAAVLHNFAWHIHWTWRERSSLNRIGKRFLSFHLTNALISFCGNILVMQILVGFVHLPVLLSNMIAITACSLANFFASDRIVFKA